MRAAFLMLRYSWRDLVFALLLFLVGWHGYTVYSGVGNVREKLVMSVGQSARLIDQALEDGDIVALRNLLGNLLVEGVQDVRFNGARGGPLESLARIVVGSPISRIWGVREGSVNVTYSGALIGRVDYQIDLLQISKKAARENGTLYLIVALFMIVIAVFANAGALRTLSRVEQGLHEFAASERATGLAELKQYLLKESASERLDPLTRSFVSLLTRHVEDAERATAVQGELAASRKLVDLASQVAHDIRSPLTVLEAAAGLSGNQEDQRTLIRRATTHIRDIANNLLYRYGAMDAAHSKALPARTAPEQEAARPAMLGALVDELAKEKRLQYRDRQGVVIEASVDAHSYTLFASVNPTDFRRLLSNLVNNSVEALRDGVGRVDVDLTARDGRALLAVHDNGRGIPVDILRKLGERGSTHGKPGGSGLGLAHAKACVETWGGSLSLESTVGKGTIVTVSLPLAPAAAWFVRELALAAETAVVILDDDTSIHELWRSRLKTPGAERGAIEIVHAFSPDDLRTWIGKYPEKARQARYLLDHNLSGYTENGLLLAESLDLGNRAVLVTSAYDDPMIARRCEELHMGLVPKSLAGVVPIRIAATPGSVPELLDAVLIDDDGLVQTLWLGAAQDNQKRLKVFSRASDFVAVAGNIDKRSPIYVDWDLGDSKYGGDVALDLSSMGFETLYLATGQVREGLGEMPWITRIVDKKDPWSA